MNSGIAAEQQSSLVNHLYQNLTAITDVADHSENAARNTSDLAEQMAYSADHLQDTLSKFRGHS